MTSGMSGAYIELSDWSSRSVIHRISFPFDPDKFSMSLQGKWSEPGNSGAIQYLGSAPRSVTVPVFLDARAKPGFDVDVAESVDILASACYPTAASENTNEPIGPRAKFGWDRVYIDGYVSNVSVDYQMFDRFGAPMRALCQVTINEVIEKPAGQNPTSGTRAVHRTLETIAGDTLPGLAYKELGDPTRWRAIAELNGIDDPMRVRPGTRLLVPARGELAGEG